MLRVGVVTTVLLLGASYLLFGAWWTPTERGDGPAPATGPVETGAPELAATATKPMTPDTDGEARVAARHLLDELRQMTETEQARHLAHRATSTPDARVPFSEELVAHLVALLRSKDPHLAQAATSLLLRMGPRVAPLLRPFLASDATEAPKTRALWMIGGWQIQSPSVELPPLLVDLAHTGETKESEAALQALGYARKEHLAPHLPLLAARIADPAEDVSLRIAAALALRAILERARTDGDEAVRQRAERFLARIDAHR